MDSDLQSANAWVLSVQTTLYQWSRQHPDEAYRELWNWVTDPRNLRCAWQRIATNKGHRTPGIDGQTVGRIRQAEGETLFLDQLRRALRSGSYRPSPCRRKLIPKPGKPGSFRPLGIPTIKDRYNARSSRSWSRSLKHNSGMSRMGFVLDEAVMALWSTFV